MSHSFIHSFVFCFRCCSRRRTFAALASFIDRHALQGLFDVLTTPFPCWFATRWTLDSHTHVWTTTDAKNVQPIWKKRKSMIVMSATVNDVLDGCLYIYVYMAWLKSRKKKHRSGTPFFLALFVLLLIRETKTRGSCCREKWRSGRLLPVIGSWQQSAKYNSIDRCSTRINHVRYHLSLSRKNPENVDSNVDLFYYRSKGKICVQDRS